MNGMRGPLDRAARAAAKSALRGVVRRSAPRREDLPLSAWRLERDREGALTLDGVALEELLARWGSPLHVVDAERLTSNASRFLERPAGASRGCEVFYSYKTNPVPEVLRRVHAAGLGAEVVSPYELWLALRLGVDPARIVYNGPARTNDSLALAITRGVGLINVNTRSEIASLAELARDLGKTASIGVRVVAPGGAGGQFGERIDTGAALAAFRESRAHPELRVTAIHAHNNGEISSLPQLEAFLSALLSFADELVSQLGIAIDILDLGGNLPCPTVSHPSPRDRRLAMTFGCEPTPRPPESVLSIDAYVQHVVRRVEDHFAGRPAPRIFLEPGRAMTSNAQMLLCRVMSIRDRDEAGMTWAVLDAGIAVAEAVRNEFHQLFPLASRPGAEARLYRLMGPSCTLADLLYAAWRLPELAPGDALAIMDSGAYFVPYSACFSFPRPAVVVLANGHAEVARRAETFDDLIALDEIAGDG